MEKEFNIIQMEIFNMKVIGLMIKKKEIKKKQIEGNGGTVSSINLKCGNGDGKGEGEDGRETIPKKKFITKSCLDCHGENIIKSNYIISSIFVLALILF